ncbi:MAG TPA: AMP-binding protein, partial [Methylomirabilota bacterium]|nr:AMP-binding protein [Methylomirabilota bacterium]
MSAIPGPRLRLRAGYDGSKYDRSAVARLLGHWRQTLAALAANPTGRVGTIPLLSGEEQGALLAMGAGAAAAAAPAIVERVGEEAGRRPDGMAATDDGGRHWTYGALDACAQQGARALRQAGVGPETPVGVCLTRTADLLVTLVAVWQAGGVVVPLDPTAPAARLAWLCEDAGVRLVVSDAAARANLPRACRVLERAPRAAAAGAAPRAPRAPGGELAYVIYTSGSTGQPKGVGVSHAALSAVLAAAHAEVPLGPDDMGACLASLAFDIAFWELVLPWMGGGTTRVVAREVVQDARALVATLPAVTVLHGVPSVW